MNRVSQMLGKRLFAMSSITVPVVAAGLVVSPCTPLFAQASTQFEVASIKPSAPGGRGIQIQISPGGRFTAKNVTARFLMQQAFGIRDFQISGAPGWAGSERYDVTAKAEGNATPEQLKPMLQALLAERFQLKFHRETKEAMGYLLVVGKNGPKMKQSPDSDDGPGPAQGPRPGGGPGGPGPGAGPGGPGGPGGPRGGMVRMGRGLIDAQGVPMTMLATQLSNQLGRSVVDKTGLKGDYDVKLEWNPDDSQALGPREVGNETAAPVDSVGPSIFTALQEQLGLKLEGQKGPVDLLILDKIEKPVEN